MQRITKAAAEAALEKLDLSATNRAFAGYWLSLWQGDDLPRVERFNSALVRELVPNLVVFDAVPGKYVMVRKAGRETCAIVGEELDGIDWVMTARVRNRRLRMRNFDMLMDGAILFARRRLTMLSGSPAFNQELVLPFAGDPDGVHPIVAHTDWRIDQAQRLNGIAEIEPLARDHRLLSIQSRKRRSVRA